MVKPSLIIGLGGSGVNTLHWIKQHLSDFGSSGDQQAVQLLAFDWSKPDQEPITIAGSTHQKQELLIPRVKLSDFEQVFLGRDLFPIIQQIAHGNYFPSLAPMAREWLRTLVRQEFIVPTNAPHALVRLTLLFNLIHGFNSDLLRPLRYRLEFIAQNHPKEDIDIYLVSSSFGSTGSAWLVDFAHLCRCLGQHLGLSTHVHAVLVLPNAYKRIFPIQTYQLNKHKITMQEIEQFQSEDAIGTRMYEFRIEVGFEYLASKPFDSIQLIDGSAPPLLNNNSKPGLFAYIADGILAQLDPQVHDAISRIKHPKLSEYSTFGIHSIVIPEEELSCFFTSKLIEQGVLTMLGVTRSTEKFAEFVPKFEGQGVLESQFLSNTYGVIPDLKLMCEDRPRLRHEIERRGLNSWLKILENVPDFQDKERYEKRLDNIQLFEADKNGLPIRQKSIDVRDILGSIDYHREHVLGVKYIYRKFETYEELIDYLRDQRKIIYDLNFIDHDHYGEVEAYRSIFRRGLILSVWNAFIQPIENWLNCLPDSSRTLSWPEIKKEIRKIFTLLEEYHELLEPAFFHAYPDYYGKLFFDNEYCRIRIRQAANSGIFSGFRVRKEWERYAISEKRRCDFEFREIILKTIRQSVEISIQLIGKFLDSLQFWEKFLGVIGDPSNNKNILSLSAADKYLWLDALRLDYLPSRSLPDHFSAIVFSDEAARFMPVFREAFQHVFANDRWKFQIVSSKETMWDMSEWPFNVQVDLGHSSLSLIPAEAKQDSDVERLYHQLVRQTAVLIQRSRLPSWSDVIQDIDRNNQQLIDNSTPQLSLLNPNNLPLPILTVLLLPKPSSPEEKDLFDQVRKSIQAKLINNDPLIIEADEKMIRLFQFAKIAAGDHQI